MHILTIVFLTPLLTIVSSYPTRGITPEFVPEAAAESRLVPRRGNNSGSDLANAIDMDLDCTGTEDTCDADAFAMLCLGAPRTLQERP